jgi:small redox-active disulfide protein 2
MLEIKVLGPGCPRCERLFNAVDQATGELGLQRQLEKVTDIAAITGYGVMMTPALVVNDEVKTVGRIPDVEELKALLAECERGGV